MRLLLTGASSFTGYCFVKEMSAAGHEVHATLTRNLEDYSGLRRARVEDLQHCCTLHPALTFGSPGFLSLVEESWDCFCHHAAEVTDYRSPHFDIAAALHKNTYNVAEVTKALAASDCRRLLLTGTVFEAGEGVGSDPGRAFSPYGLSKGLTAEVFKYYCHTEDLNFGKFVIPNPFGPMEEPRFTQYLAKTWLIGEVPSVRTPGYIRDNIHVSLLAKAYRAFMERFVSTGGELSCHPSGYVESQGSFAQRMAHEMEQRWDQPCPLNLALQTEFPEPLVRINTDHLDVETFDWDESKAWDDLALFYLEQHNCVNIGV